MTTSSQPATKDPVLLETDWMSHMTVKEANRLQRGRTAPRIGAWLAISLLGLGMPWVTSLYTLELLVQGLTLGIVALGVGWLRRQTGMLSFGHAMFYGTAAYGVAIAANYFEFNTTQAVIFGLVAGTTLALIVGLIVMRASGVAFSMLTLAIGMLMWVVVTQNRTFTNGYDGLPIRFNGTLLGLEPRQLLNPVQAWPYVWLLMMAVIAAAWLVSRTVFGRFLGAMRENEERARYIGRSIYIPKVVAFTFTGFLGSLAGTVLAVNVAYVSPESLFWMMSGNALIVAVIGGIGSVWGPPIGAVMYIFLQSSLSDSPYYQLIIGTVLIVVVVLAPGGLSGLVEKFFRRLVPPMSAATVKEK